MENIFINNIDINIKKFGSFAMAENGIVLKTKTKEETTVLFSELNKIYITKSNYSLTRKLILMTIVFLLTTIFSVYLSIELITITTILYIPLIVKMNTYKKYELTLQLHDGTFFIKGFNKETKQDCINVVNLIRKKIFENKMNFNIQIESLPIQTPIVEDHLLSSLSFA